MTDEHIKMLVDGYHDLLIDDCEGDRAEMLKVAKSLVSLIESWEPSAHDPRPDPSPHPEYWTE